MPDFTFETAEEKVGRSFPAPVVPRIVFQTHNRRGVLTAHGLAIEVKSSNTLGEVIWVRNDSVMDERDIHKALIAEIVSKDRDNWRLERRLIEATEAAEQLQADGPTDAHEEQA